MTRGKIYRGRWSQDIDWTLDGKPVVIQVYIKPREKDVGFPGDVEIEEIHDSKGNSLFLDEEKLENLESLLYREIFTY